jgi:GntR family transcriptional regulator/MocR family aminotransferase
MSTSLVASLSLRLELKKQGAVPLFLQLYGGLRAAILAGHLEGGTRLPPTRQLAAELEISRKTVVKAFEQLIAEGYLEGKVGSGTYVARVLPEEMLQVSRPASSAAFSTPSPKHIPHLSAWGTSLANRDMGSIAGGNTMQAFSPGIPALDEFPYRLWSRLASHSWRLLKGNQLSYSDPLGYWPLREAIASYLRAVRGMDCEPEQVIIMTGMPQTLDLVSKLVLNLGETALVEDPSLPEVRQVLKDAGAAVVPVAVDQHGLSVERLANDEQSGQHGRLVYVTPSHQYPLGVTLSLSRRLALLRWAARTGAWILEDDYDSEYRYEGRPLAALQGLDHAGCVLYMGTFSKVLFPALRLSYLVVPAASVDLFARGRAALAREAPVMEQVVLTEFFTEGHFARHLRRMNGIYQERQAILIEAVRQRLAGELEIKPATTGLHVMGWLCPGVDDRHVWQLSMARGVDVPPLSAHTLCPQPRGGLVLGYACVSPPEIRAGVDQLALALEAMGQERKGR